MVYTLRMFKRLHVSELPKRPRKSTSRFEKTPEWKDLKASLDAGFKPLEALMVVLTPEDKAKYRIASRRTVARFIQNYLTEHQLPYKLRSFAQEGIGDFFSVYAPGSSKSKKRK